MAIESVVSPVLSMEGTNGISKAAGVTDTQTRGILDAALPLLLSGALNQSNNSATANGFANALTQHAADNTNDVGAFMAGVDMKDGEKIVNHLLGANAKNTIAQIAKKTGVKQADVKKVLAASAPLLMSLLGKEVGAQQQQQQAAGGNAGVAGILGAMLGGGGNATTNLLMGLLGGGAGAAANQASNGGNTNNNAGGGIGSLLTGLLT